MISSTYEAFCKLNIDRAAIGLGKSENDIGLSDWIKGECSKWDYCNKDGVNDYPSEFDTDLAEIFHINYTEDSNITVIMEVIFAMAAVLLAE